ncbi:external alternative NAD(P)H-ubiquinone oxidoreductase B2, mitochondrial-like [Rutidosis leptorrhynchoides]|uniref:external alternative NAD(P)H-ubiquinone oxidoreductase B2, mitochondrial-like n=1 Tax=Rutidosis leptorrhynchoides TaxID=125765 RepID=UPI003A98FEEC
MKGSYYTFYQRASNAFRDHPNLSKILIIGTISGGGLVAYSEVRPFGNHVYADAAQPTIKKKKVVVLGTGWAGTSFLKNLKDPSLDVQVVSPCNYFAFTPLLPSVTVGTVEARSVVEPIRNIVRKKNFDVRFKEAECFKIDTVNKKVHCKSTQTSNLGGKEEFTLDYDYLVIAMGARANTFNTPGVVENAHFLKEVEDALRIRRSIIDCFERASLPSLSEDERRRILHFVVVGGGPTGVEFAAELHDFLHEDLLKLYPDLKKYISITLLEAGAHILNMFDKRITDFAEEKFKRDGINVKTGSMVVKVSDKAISLKEISSGENKDLPYGMVVWSTGIGTRPVIMDFMKQIGQGNRRVMATDEWLRVEGVPNVYALGDCSTINQRRVMEDISAIFSKADKNKTGKLNVEDFTEVINDITERYPQVELHLKSKKLKNFVQLLKSQQDEAAKKSTQLDIEKFKAALSEVDTKMKSLPPTAQVAAQQGEYLAKCFNRMKECEENPEGPIRFRDTGRHRFKPFRYKHLGQFAPLGGEQTAAQLPGDWVSIGHSTQWLWYSVYASKLVSWRTRVLVIGDWGRRFIFGRDSSRI